MRIVLSWGAKIRDIDAYIYLPNGSKVYYGNKISTDQKVNLDVDGTKYNGMETITLKDDISPYYVNNFSKETPLQDS